MNHKQLKEHVGFLEKTNAELQKNLAFAVSNCDALVKQVGSLPEGAHPDELKPRGETWLAERANWTAEVEALKAGIQLERQKIAEAAQRISEIEAENTFLGQQLGASENQVRSLQCALELARNPLPPHAAPPISPNAAQLAQIIQ